MLSSTHKVQCPICISSQQCCYLYMCVGGSPPIPQVPTALVCSAAAVGSKITQNRSLMIMVDRRQTTREKKQDRKCFGFQKWFITKIFLTYCEKNCFSDQEKLLKFEAEGREFAKFLRSIEQFIQTVKSQNKFW